MKYTRRKFISTLGAGSAFLMLPQFQNSPVNFFRMRKNLV